MNVSMTLAPAGTHEVSVRLEGVVQSARELVAFAEGDPVFASKAGVEVAALEAKMLLGDPAIRSLHSRSLGSPDLEKLERLEGIVALSSNRMGECIASMDAEMSGSAVNSLGQIISLAGGAIGIVRSIL